MEKPDSTCLGAICGALDKLGVPRESKWRALILYMRSIKDFDFLDADQKGRIQRLVVRVLTDKDFSEDRFDAIILENERILFDPWRRKIETAVKETASLVDEFQSVFAKRRGDVQNLETTAVGAVESGDDITSVVTKIKKGFRQVALAMQKDAEDLVTLSMTDALTHIGNRRAFDRFIENAVAAANQKGAPLSLIMLDIDHFKKFNDEFGHLIGDQALATVASILKAFAEDMGSMEGKTLFPARFGGEEFMMVAPGAPKLEAGDMAEILRQRIGKYNFIIRNAEGEIVSSGVRLNVSLGVAELGEDCAKPEAAWLVEVADKALYEAKRGGRNRVCLSAPSQSAGDGE